MDIFMDTINAGAILEGPVGSGEHKGSFLIGARQSYIGAVLGLVAKNNDNFNLTVAPKYSDATALYEKPITDRDDIRITAFASQDSLEFLLKEPVKKDPALRGEFETKTSFFRLIPQLTHRHSERTLSKWSLGVGRDWLKAKTPDNSFRVRTIVLTTRAELEAQAFAQWKTYVGMDHQFSWAQSHINLPSFFSQAVFRTLFLWGAVVKPQSSIASTYLDFIVSRNSSILRTK